MEIYVNPVREQWRKLMERPLIEQSDIDSRVRAILERVKADGDKALRGLAQEIDRVSLDCLEVSQDEIKEACELLEPNIKDSVRVAAANIEKFHKAQMPSEVVVETMEGVRCVQRAIGLNRVGLYIPGGSAPLFSTVLMLAIPARIAQCKEVVLCTPCNKEGKVAPAVLYAASYCGVDRIFKVGGAQAVAAMAYGTGTIPQVDKIFGPGNQYVTEAKQQLGGRVVAIDMPAGPSEVLVMADQSADVEFVASDMLSQAEHGVDSQVMLICSSEEFAYSVKEEVYRQAEKLDRKSIVIRALENARVVVLESEDDKIDFTNGYAPEHLIISLNNPWSVADRIISAGRIFIGNYTPESAGDYASGTNHTLPTYGWARSYSGVNLDSFMRKMTIQEISKEGLKELGGVIMNMAEAEGLSAHRNAVYVRLNKI